jgi:hypothetical protein
VQIVNKIDYLKISMETDRAKVQHVPEPTFIVNVAYHKTVTPESPSVGIPITGT